MFHACVQRFNVTGRKENFWKLNMALVGEFFFRKYHVGCLVRCRKGFSNTNKKLIT
jgi:hypothetical protein